MAFDIEYDIDVLEGTTVVKVYNIIEELKDRLVSDGYTVENLDALSTRMPYSVPVRLIRQQLQIIEDDLTKINIDEVQSIYYDNHIDVGMLFTLSDYQRWWLILHDLYDIIINGNNRWLQMTLSLEDGNPDAQDINNDDIWIRGDTIG
jgi:hypothetical protein